MCLGSKISGTVREIPRDRLLFFTGKRFLHCTEPWQGRRVVLVAYTLVGSISILYCTRIRRKTRGARNTTSLDVEYYFQNPVGPGQPEQSRLPFVPKRSGGVWKAGLLNHNIVGCMNVDSLDSQDMETNNCVFARLSPFMILSLQRHRAVKSERRWTVCNTPRPILFPA